MAWSASGKNQPPESSSLLDSLIRSGDPGILCKLDLEKAYDNVNRDFLLYLLKRCGLGRDGEVGQIIAYLQCGFLFSLMGLLLAFLVVRVD
jgi:hypothetical protein